MNIIVEKREIVGTLKTLVGTFPLLSMSPTKYELSSMAEVQSGALCFNVVDDEQFDNWIVVRGDFVKVPNTFPSFVEVKRAVTQEEFQTYKESQEQLSVE